ncbi:MAG: transposase [Candidatus Omnitrophota bacterium]
MYQPSLIFTKETNLDYLKKLEIVFSSITMPRCKTYTTGRPSYSIRAMVNALIFKNLRGLLNLADLVRELSSYPALAQACGFKSFPTKERFSRFLRYTDNSLLRSIKESLIKELIARGEIKGEYVSCDSCPIKAPVKENNLKTNVRDRFNKHKIPSGDKDARLGAYVVYPKAKKTVEFFWGYRNHVVCDAVSELPLAELTRPANIHESILLIQQLEYLKSAFSLPVKAVIADSALDSSAIIEYIVKTFEAKPIIAKNPRGGGNPDIKLSSKGIPICIAGIEMLSRGKYYDKEQNRIRHKFVCPIKGSKRLAEKYFFCPWNHPKFFTNRLGCTTNLRVDVDTSIRASIDYGSQTFKKLYALRTASERIFSRLSILSIQRSSVKGLNATANLCSLAHIAILAIALAAAKHDPADPKIRFIKSFFTV